MNQAKTSLLHLDQLLEPTFFQPPPGLEMFGPGSVVSMQEAQTMQSGDCDKDASVSECSTADTEEADESSSLAGSYYCPGDVLKMSAQVSRGGLEASARSQQVIQLETVLPEETCGSPGCPSIGSVGHHLGMCKPCDFMFRGDGCRADSKCQYCHLCPPGETQRRKKVKKAAARMMTRMTATQAWPQTFASAMFPSIEQQP